MNIDRKILIIVVLLAILASGCSSQTSQPITQVIAFGDSFSDNGNSFRITQEDVKNNVPDTLIMPSSDLYWEGRWSNGPTAVEVLAQRLQVKLTDYAVGGAQSGLYNNITMGGMNDTGLLSQVNSFQTDLQGKKSDPGALYFIFISANDFISNFWSGYGGSYSETADKSVENIQTAITKLSELGAKRFLVVNSFDLSVMPLVVTAKVEDAAKEFRDRFDSQLSTKMSDFGKQKNIEIKLFDFQSISDKIRSNPQNYGLKQLTDPCMTETETGGTTTCANPDDYYFWDFGHPSRRVHQIVGEAMAAEYGK